MLWHSRTSGGQINSWLCKSQLTVHKYLVFIECVFQPNRTYAWGGPIQCTLFPGCGWNLEWSVGVGMEVGGWNVSHTSGVGSVQWVELVRLIDLCDLPPSLCTWTCALVVSITTPERKLTVGGFYKVNSPIMGGHITEVGVCSGSAGKKLANPLSGLWVVCCLSSLWVPLWG